MKRLRTMPLASRYVIDPLAYTGREIADAVASDVLAVVSRLLSEREARGFEQGRAAGIGEAVTLTTAALRQTADDLTARGDHTFALVLDALVAGMPDVTRALLPTPVPEPERQEGAGQ